MTEKYYLDDSYLFEFEARVTDVQKKDSGWEIILDATAFYPESGGQLFDTGQLDGQQVINVYENDAGDVVHVCPAWSATVDDVVAGRIDIDRRLDNMRKHTGQHILSQAFVRTIGAETVGAHLGDVESTIELSLESLTDNEILEIDKTANEAVMRNLPVKIFYCERDELEKFQVRRIPERQGRYRIVQIGDYECTACGGTHCSSTGEVGLIKIISQEKIRGNIRVTFLVGPRALEDYHRKHNVITSLSTRLTCHFEDLDSSVEKITGQNSELRKEIGRLNRELMPAEIERLRNNGIKTDKFLIIARFYKDQDFKYLRELILALTQSSKIIALFMIDDKLMISVSESIEPHAADLAELFMKQYGGRGGGNPALAQVGGIPEGKRESYLNDFTDFIKDEFGA